MERAARLTSQSSQKPTSRSEFGLSSSGLSSSSENVTTLKKARSDDDSDKFEQMQKMLDSWKADQDKILNKLVADVTELKEQGLLIQKTNLDIEKAIEYMNKSYEDLRNRVEILEKEHKLYNDHNSAINKLENKIDTLEQQARQCNVEICNVPEKRNENLITILETLGNIIKFPISQSDVISVHRVPHASQDSKPKNIIVKFTSRMLRDNLLSACRKTKNIKSDQLGISGTSMSVYINEHLTLKSKMLFRKCREIAKEHQYSFVWVKNATILARKQEGLPAFAIRTKEDLQKIQNFASKNIKANN